MQIEERLKTRKGGLSSRTLETVSAVGANINAYKRRVFWTIRRYRMVEMGDVIYVAVSGGKDSCAALALLKEYVDAHRVDAEVRALHINLGFAPSRAAEEAARAAAETLGVDIRVVSAGEYLDIIAAARRAGRPVCSVCGTLKRYIINRVPRELGATKVATGHHAHDFLVYYFKNLAGCHHEWNFKILPVVKGSGSALTRIRPLILARPEENAEYCKQARLPFTEACCEHKPERPPGSWVLEMLAAARRAEPDVDIRLVSAIMKFNEKYGRAGAPEGIGRCKVCGEPSGGDVCAVCRLRKLLSRQHG